MLGVEFKSQVGPSFGNNFNNRTEEAIGSETDTWTAYREGRFGSFPAPFLGYLFLFEDCRDVHRPIRNRQPYFTVDHIFEGASYAQRYRALCERLMMERLYNACCLTLTTNENPTMISHPSAALSLAHFAAAVQAHARVFLATSS